MKELTEKQQEILDFIVACFREEGYIPTLREIATAFSFRSLNAVNDHLAAIERKGYITRRPGSSRGITLPPELLGGAVEQTRVVALDDEEDFAAPTTRQISREDAARTTSAQRKKGRLQDVGTEEQPFGEGPTDEPEREGSAPQQSGIPIIGRAAAGRPITAIENLDGYLNLGALYGREHFALHIRGDSMIDAGIWDGDFVIVREQPRVNNGEIAVAVIEGEATVKRIRIEGARAELIPANELYSPILVDLSTTDFRIAGRVVGVHRVLR